MYMKSPDTQLSVQNDGKMAIAGWCQVLPRAKRSGQDVVAMQVKAQDSSQDVLEDGVNVDLF
jgi:hypothetical protein